MSSSLIGFSFLLLTCTQTFQAQVYRYPGPDLPVALVVDGIGNMIMAGSNGAVTKLRPDGTTVFSLQLNLGSTSNPGTTAIGVDRAGNILLAAGSGIGLPVTPDAPQPKSYGGYSQGGFFFVPTNLYLARFDPNGNLTSATYFGGPGGIFVQHVSFDQDGGVYILGNAGTPPPGQSDPYFPDLRPGGGVGAWFIMKWRPGEGHFGFVTRLSSGLVNTYTQMAFDAAGNMVFASQAGPSLAALPTTPGVLKPRRSGAEDIYVGKRDPSSGRLLYGTFLPVTAPSQAIAGASPQALAVDAAGNAWVASSFAASSGTGNTLIKLSSDGSKILYSEATFAEFFGFSLFHHDVSFDSDGNLLVVGFTDLTLPTNPDAPLRAPCVDGFPQNLLYRKISPEGTQLYASYLSTGSVFIDDVAAFDPQGRPYLVEFTQSHYEIVRRDFAIQSEPNVTCLVNPARGLGQWASPPSLTSTRRPLIVPGQLVTIAGAALGPVSAVNARFDEQGNLPLELAGVRVLLDGASMPIVSAQYGLVTISVPETLTGAAASLEVESNGLKTAPISVGVGASAFYLFTRDGIGRGPAAAINQDRSINSPEHAAPVGSIVSVFGTGAGVKAPVQVLVNSQPAIIEYAGPAPGLVPGVTQVNFRVPATRSGTAVISVGPSAAFPWPAVTIEVGN